MYHHNHKKNPILLLFHIQITKFKPIYSYYISILKILYILALQMYNKFFLNNPYINYKDFSF